MTRLLLLATALFLFVFIPASSTCARNCGGLVELELRLDETTILPSGVLVGELVFANTGSHKCRFGGVMKIDSEQLSYELQLLDGEIVKLRRIRMAHGRTIQWAELEPGEETHHPVCLMKLDGKFIFEKEGSYRIRAIFRSWELATKDRNTGKRLEGEKFFVGESEWVEFIVGPTGRGRPHYLNSHPEENVYAAFNHSKEAKAIQANLNSYHDYRHEQEKFLVYQLYGYSIVGGVVKFHKHDEQLIAEANEMLDLAWQWGIGIPMWGWMVKRLESFPLELEGRQRFNTANGYYF